MSTFKAVMHLGNLNKETNKPDTFIVDGKETHTLTLTGESEKSMSAAVGNLLAAANNFLHGNSQFPNPFATVNGVKLSSASAKKLRQEFVKFRLDFGIIRTEILSGTALLSKEAGEAFIRETDRNGVFKNTKSFTIEQVAAQIVEQRRVVKDLTKWAKEDAKASVVTPELEARRALAKELATQKRLAAKAAKALLEAAAEKTSAKVEA